MSHTKTNQNIVAVALFPFAKKRGSACHGDTTIYTTNRKSNKHNKDRPSNCGPTSGQALGFPTQKGRPRKLSRLPPIRRPRLFVLEHIFSTHRKRKKKTTRNTHVNTKKKSPAKSAPSKNNNILLLILYSSIHKNKKKACIMWILLSTLCCTAVQLRIVTVWGDSPPLRRKPKTSPEMARSQNNSRQYPTYAQKHNDVLLFQRSVPPFSLSFALGRLPYLQVLSLFPLSVLPSVTSHPLPL